MPRPEPYRNEPQLYATRAAAHASTATGGGFTLASMGATEAATLAADAENGRSFVVTPVVDGRACGPVLVPLVTDSASAKAAADRIAEAVAAHLRA